jgi:glutamate/aspartate transport system permease protein
MNLNFEFLNWGVVSNYLLKGLFFSVQLTLVAMTCGIILGTILALMRLSSKKWLRIPAGFYVDTMRSIPLVMVILWFFLLIPAYFYTLAPYGVGLKYRSELAAIITFTAFEAAYYAEIMRAGINSVSKGQVNAGYAVGMTYAQCMQLVILPQAFRNMVPVLMSQTIILFQDTSLVYAIGAYDLLKGFDLMAKNLGRPVESYLMATVIYFIICFSMSMLVRRFQKRISIIR